MIVVSYRSSEEARTTQLTKIVEDEDGDDDHDAFEQESVRVADTMLNWKIALTGFFSFFYWLSSIDPLTALFK